MPLLLDTGVIYALADTDDAWHRRVLNYLQRVREVLMAPITVVPEVAYLLRARLGPDAECKFVDSLAKGEIVVEALSGADLQRSVVLMQAYKSIGFVDASVVAVAERLRLREIATVDRRHFSQIQPKHIPAFRLVP
jgi:predicted nucleic acid-binding protein